MADDNFAATRISGGILRYEDIQREVGVAGVSMPQTWDLTVFPKTIREDPVFRDQLDATFQGFDGVSKVASASILPAAPALPEQLQVLIDAAMPTDRVDLLLVLPHSLIR